MQFVLMVGRSKLSSYAPLRPAAEGAAVEDEQR